METITVISPIFDKDISQHLNTSPIWSEAYHPDEELPKDKRLVIYRIKFDGLKPIQVLQTKHI